MILEFKDENIRLINCLINNYRMMVTQRELLDGALNRMRTEIVAIINNVEDKEIQRLLMNDIRGI